MIAVRGAAVNTRRRSLSTEHEGAKGEPCATKLAKEDGVSVSCDLWIFLVSFVIYEASRSWSVRSGERAATFTVHGTRRREG